MKSRLIKTYSNWLAEAAEATTGAQPAASNEVNGIAFIAASASASNLADGAKFGIKKDIVYTITVPNLGILRFLTDDGNRFGGPNTKSEANPNGRISINLDSTEKTAKPGDDMLEINGKKIMETGDLLIKKSELNGPVTIKASNNGILVLLRFSNALADMKTRFNFYIGNCKNFAVKFTLGRDIASADARGFMYYWTKPGALGGISSAIASSLSLATLELLGLQSSIATTDSVFKSHYAWVQGKDSATAANEITKKVAGFIKGNRTLVNDPLSDTSNVLAAITKPNQSKLVVGDPRTGKYKLTDAGLKTLEESFRTIVKAIAPVKPPAEFAEATDVFSDYGTIVTNNLLTKANSDGISHWFNLVQSVQNWKAGVPSPGDSGTGSAKQKEGQVGNR